MNDQIFSSKEVAAMLGVNESSIKRWADSGKMRCIKTPGGHRKFRLSDLQEFLVTTKFSGIPFSNPITENLGDSKLTYSVKYRDYPALTQLLYQYALDADSSKIFNLFTVLAVHDYDYAEIFDLILAPALHQIGSDWERGTVSIDQEHAASAAVFDALVRVGHHSAKKMPDSKKAIVAVAGNDLHELPAKSLAVLLELKGWQVLYLGANTPVDSISQAVARANPEAVLLSMTLDPGNSDLLGQIKNLKSGIMPKGSKLVVGGAGTERLRQFLPEVNFWAKNFRETLQFLQQ